MRILTKLLAVVLAVGCPAIALAQSNDLNSESSGRSSRSSRSSRNSSTDSASGTSSRGETTSDRERGRKRDSQSRESNSRSSSRNKSDNGDKKPTDPKAAGAAGAAADTKTVKGKPAASKGKSSGSGGKPAVDIKFEMQADPETNIMYLEALGDQPSLNVSVLEKKKFITRLNLYNPRSSGFSQLDASIKFDPGLLRPVGVDDSMIRSNLAKPSRVLVDQKKGLLSVAADFQTSRSDTFLNILKIQWEALEPVASTPLAFVNTPEHPSGVFDASGANILHMRSDGTVESSTNTGLLDATVSIEPTNGTVELAEGSGNPFSAVALATNINAGTAEGGIQLSLQPRKPTVRVGEDFLVDIVYDNPKRADMDTVKLKLRFNPEVLQVVDFDEGNWITQGINIFDGDYHDALPFDHHRKNTVYNGTGVIVYDNGFGSRTPVSEHGTIATVRFRAIAPANSTSIAFVTGDEAAINQETAVSFLGFNLIGIPGKRENAISNAAVGVAP